MLIAITGVSRGLGRALAVEFATGGHHVVGCARNEEAMADLQQSLGDPHRFDSVDVSDDVQVEQWANRIIRDLGVPDFLINAAALMNRSASLWQVSDQEFSDLIDVNIKGVFQTIRHFAPPMIEFGRGVFVNFSSYWGRSTSSDVAAYCASKWAIEGLSRGLADDLPTGPASVALNPGVIHTAMLESCFGDAAASYPSPEQWGKAAVPYILSLSGKDNGASVTVPGF